jgi:hypothetical protein
LNDFATELLVNSVPHIFLFNRVLTAGSSRYYISVSNEEKLSYLFQMDQSDSSGNWKIIDAPQVPAWIHKLETELAQAIIDHGPVDPTPAS